MGENLPAYLRAAHNRFTQMTRRWEKPPSLVAGLQPLKISMGRFEPSRMIAP